MIFAAVEFRAHRFAQWRQARTQICDRVAAYGLAALVAGVAAKKLGLLALFAAFVVKFAKVIVIAIAAFGAAIVRWFKARAGSKDSAA